MKKQKHILLTGATGFFGKSLLRYLINEAASGNEMPFVTIISRNPNRFAEQNPELVRHSWLHMHQGDITDVDTLPVKTSFTHILHAAADSTLGPKLSPLERYDQIVNGTRNMLDFAIKCGVSRFLFTSSGAVYGPQPQNLKSLPESWNGIPDPLNSKNAYGVAKRAAEHNCILYGDRYQFQVVIARCFAFVGPDLPLDVHFAIGNFIRDALWRDEITVAGDGTPIRTYLYQSELAEWLFKLLDYGKNGQAYNVGSDQAITVAELAHLVRDVIAPNKKVNIEKTMTNNNERNIYIPNIEKISRQLNLNIKYSLKEAIEKTAQKYTSKNNIF